MNRYTAGLDESSFIRDQMRIDAVERCLLRLSEAATKLGPLAEQLEPAIPGKIRGYGNFLRHEYDVIEPKDLWAIANNELPPLLAACKRALQHLQQP